MKKIIILLFLISFSMVPQINAQSSPGDWVVEVHLKNGSKIKGVVLGGRFIEKAFQNTRIYEEVNDFRIPKAGIRIWYAKNNPGYFFIYYEEIRRVVKLGRLSLAAKKEIQRRIRVEIAEAKKAGEEEKKRERAELKKAGIGITQEEEQKFQSQKSKMIKERALQQLNMTELLSSLPQHAQELLKKFPPDEGWSEKLYERIRPRVLRAKAQRNFKGLPVSYRKFVDNFDEWKSAVDLMEQKKKAKLEELKAKIAKSLESFNKLPVKEGPSNTEDKEKQKTQPLTKDKLAEKKAEIEEDKAFVQKAIKELLYSKSVSKRVRIMDRLGKIGSNANEATYTLRLCLKSPDAKVRQAAIRALARIKIPKEVILNTLGETLELGDLLMRREAAAAFMLFGKEADEKFDILISAATLDEDAKVRFRALRVLELIGDKKAISSIQTRIWDENLAVQVAACSALLKLMDREAEDLDKWFREPLVKGLFHSEANIRILASESIKRLVKRMKNHAKKKDFSDELKSIVTKMKGEVKINLEDSIALLNKVEEQKKKVQEEREKAKKATKKNKEIEDFWEGEDF